ncbi:hypothetical protein RJT34_00389 [Clitoria ternatea]|uniref:ATP-dependent DNA helicase n=1 Tax=Clitoria ternatea TaxID=43366 RepID=A0AAN9KF73_CLITE
MRFFTLEVVVAAYRNCSTKGYSSKPSYGSYTKYNKKTTAVERKKPQRRPKVQWTEEQKSVLSAVTEGSSVFITGSAGTGKSKVLTEVVMSLKKLHTPSKVFVTASTGVAAFAIKGQTLHSFAGVPCSVDDPEKFLEDIRSNRRACRRWQKVKALVVDEISMVDARLFDYLEFVARELRDVDEIWGGIQLVVVGDFCQLPPIPDHNSGDCVKYAFEADCWDNSFDAQIELTKIFRQCDPRFIELLEGIRKGETDHVDLSFLEKHCSKNECDPSAVQLFPLKKIVENVNKKKLKSLQEDVVVYRAVDSVKGDGKGHSKSQLFPLKKSVENVNKKKLKSLQEDAVVYRAVDSVKGDGKDHSKSQLAQGKVPYHLKRQLEQGIAPSEIEICKGARVMLVRNLNTWKGLVNGATGTVVGFEKEDVGDVCLDNLVPVVKFDSGNTLTIKPEEWCVMDGDKIVATRKQIPLILAWALSIHKCQGMTLDKAKIDLSRAFGCGMVYTALSRVRSLDDLHLTGFKPSMIQADHKVSQFYRNLALQRSSNVDNSCIESKVGSGSITGNSEEACIAETNCYFSLSDFLARRMKRS